MTQGLASIGATRHVVLVASGAAKAAPVASFVEGPVAALPRVGAAAAPSTATVVVDEAAAVELELADYYRETYAGKPAWQHL